MKTVDDERRSLFGPALEHYVVNSFQHNYTNNNRIEKSCGSYPYYVFQCSKFRDYSFIFVATVISSWISLQLLISE